MSTTSIVYNTKGYRKNCTVRGCTINKEDSTETFETEGKVERLPSKKRTHERVLDELSSFIAEFSYLTDGQESKQETLKRPMPSYDARLVEFENNKNNPYTNNRFHRRKSVEWLDQTSSYPNHSKNERYSREAPVEYSEGEKYPYTLKKKRDVDLVCDHHRRRSLKKNQISVRKTQDGNKFYRRPKSKLESKCFDTVENVKLKSRDRKNFSKFRADSSENNRICPHHKVRGKKSKSHVRYWPFKYKQKKSKFRPEKHPIVKRKNYVSLEVKEEITSECPTVITLYPKNSDGKLCHGSYNEVEFLANPELPCKCFECMKKYESLKNISSYESETIYYKSKINFQSMKKGNGILNHPRGGDQNYPRDGDRNYLRAPFLQRKNCPCEKSPPKMYNTIDTPHQKADLQQFKSCLKKQIVPQTMASTVNVRRSICYGFNQKRKQIPFFYGCCKCPEPTKTCKNCCFILPCNQPLLPSYVNENCCRTGNFYESDSGSIDHRITPCPYPCDYEHVLSEWNLNECDEQNGGQLYKSVYFRFNCVGHQIDPAVTKYFHSILDNRIQ